MTFRQINQKFLIPGFQTLMILGIVALCQPWILFFHRYGLTIILIGLIGFIVTTKIAPDPEPEEHFGDEAMDMLTLNKAPHNNPTTTKGGTE